MSDAAFSWPPALPCPNLNSPSFNVDGGVETMEMEGGGVRQRRRHLNLAGRYRATLTVSATEHVVLLSFYNKVAGGAFDTSITLPLELGAQRVDVRARFGEAPPSKQFGVKHWTSSFELILEPVTVPDFDDLGLIAVYGDDVGAIITAFDQLANVELPDHVGAA